jgi:hypothetical protein
MVASVVEILFAPFHRGNRCPKFRLQFPEQKKGGRTPKCMIPCRRPAREEPDTCNNIRLYAHTYGTVVVVAWPEGQSLAMHGTRVLNLVLEYGTSTRHAYMHARSRVTSESILCFYVNSLF